MMRSPDLPELIDAWLDGSSTPAEADELWRRIAESREHADQFARQMTIHQLLRQAHVVHAEEKVIRTFRQRGLAESRRTQRRRLFVTGLIVVCAMAALVPWMHGVWMRGVDVSPAHVASEPASVAVGSFSRSANVKWASGAHRWSVGDALVAGNTIEIDSGRVELEFAGGAVMTVLGPAALEIQAANLVALHSGTATTRIENGNSGEFRVVTPVTEVLDLGTEFGVRARPDGQTEVVVFEGKVDVTPVRGAAGENQPAQTLSVGEAVCVNGAGDWQRVVAVDSDAFPVGDGMFSLGRRRPPVILRVSDNRATTSRPKFYAIVPGGFHEGVKAYVDRNYEWSRLDQQKFPAELMDGDYICTFNDDKRSNDFEVVVSVAGPAILYVLFDDRIPLPDWLSAGFVDTEVDVGLREMRTSPPSRRVLAGRPSSVNAGREVDYRRFSVWKREVRELSEVRLGPIGETTLKSITGGGAMYGIVAMPLALSDE